MRTTTEGRTRQGLYRSRGGIIFGLCRGFADRFDLSLLWVRVLVIVGCVVTGVWPGLIAYVIAALVVRPEPVVEFRDEADREFYDSYTHSRTLALARLKRAYDALNRRIQRMEDRVTAKGFEWDRRLQGS